MIAVSGWLVWRKTDWGREIGVYAAQLVLNAAWTPLFSAPGCWGWLSPRSW
jgi:tryptophan-rich sensory protein